MPPLPALPVHQRRVLRHAVVPHDDGVLLPLHARVEVGAPGDVLVEEIQDRVRLFLL